MELRPGEVGEGQARFQMDVVAGIASWSPACLLLVLGT